MPDVYTKNAATSAEEAAKIVPRAGFHVFGQGGVDRGEHSRLAG